MATTSHVSHVSSEPTSLSVRMPPHEDDIAAVAEDDNFPTIDKIIPRNDKVRLYFSKSATEEPDPVLSELDEAGLAELRATYNILDHIDLVPAGNDVIQVHRPGYCAFYAYPFRVGYSLPLPPLAEEFCRYYQVCPAQLSPYIYKLFLMLRKYTKLANRGVSIRHLLHLFAPNFLRGTMLHLRHHGTK